MQLSRESKIVSGVFLLLIPTIMYGGVTLLGILTEGMAGIGGRELDEMQWSLWRAGHAHAAVLVVLSLILQPLVDDTTLSNFSKWAARLGAPVSSILIPAGFFGLAFISSFKWLMYLGIIFLSVSVILTGIGLLKSSVQK